MTFQATQIDSEPFVIIVGHTKPMLTLDTEALSRLMPLIESPCIAIQLFVCVLAMSTVTLVFSLRAGM